MSLLGRFRSRMSSDPYTAVSGALDRIVALHQQRGRDKELNRRIREQMVDELGPIREYLRQHPGDEGAIRDDISTRDLDEVFPWRPFNRGRARDLAVLYCFTPYLDTSALVAARRLHMRGIVTDVISQKLDGSRRLDESSERIARQFLDRTKVLSEGNGLEMTWSAMRTFVEGVLAQVEVLQESKGPYRTLYTRAMAPQSHFAGAILKLRNPEIVWTAEFSDPLHLNAYGEVRLNDIGDDWLVDELEEAFRAAGLTVPTTRKLFEWAELVAYAFADEVMFTNDHQRRFMLEYCEERGLADRAAQIATVSHQPTLPPSFYRHSKTVYPLTDDVVNIGYFGLFFRTRGLTEVLDAISDLPAAQRAQLRLHVFNAHPVQLQEEIDQRDLASTVISRAYVPFLKFLNLTTRFDVLLVNDATTQGIFDINPYLPSKVSDYRGSGTPIWAVYEPGSVLSSMKTEYASELGDSAAATQVLQSLIADRPSK